VLVTFFVGKFLIEGTWNILAFIQSDCLYCQQGFFAIYLLETPIWK